MSHQPIRRTGLVPGLLLTITCTLTSTVALAAAPPAARDAVERAKWKPVRVLCAAVRIEAGQEVAPDQMKACELPEQFVRKSFIRLNDDADVDNALGQHVVVPLEPGDPVLFSHFELPFVLAEALPVGTRAIAIKVAPETAVGLHVLPNDRVDVIAAFRDERSKQVVARTIVQNVIVLATGRITGMTPFRIDEARKVADVTLLVLPEEAEALAVAGASGTLSLALRAPRDSAQRASPKPMTLDTLPTVTPEQLELRGSRPEPKSRQD